MAEIWDWHNHHEVICEPRTGPIEERLDYIRKHKPQSERETRLRLIAPVTVELPAALVTALAAHDKAWAASVKVRAASDTAWADAAPELERLHALDCPDALAGRCPWDGTTIFPGGHDV